MHTAKKEGADLIPDFSWSAMVMICTIVRAVRGQVPVVRPRTQTEMPAALGGCWNRGLSFRRASDTTCESPTAHSTTCPHVWAKSSPVLSDQCTFAQVPSAWPTSLPGSFRCRHLWCHSCDAFLAAIGRPACSCWPGQPAGQGARGGRQNTDTLVVHRRARKEEARAWEIF